MTPTFRPSQGNHATTPIHRESDTSPDTVANDAQAAAWGELQAGSTRALTHFMLLTVGTGLGGGIVIDGGHYRGATGASGQVGHPTIVNPDGRPCPCGKTGCWEQYASGTALVLEARAATAGLRRDLETGPPTIGEDLSLIVDIAALQTLALHIALDRGLDPDAPRNLSKVTRTI